MFCAIALMQITLSRKSCSQEDTTSKAGLIDAKMSLVAALNLEDSVDIETVHHIQLSPKLFTVVNQWRTLNEPSCPLPNIGQNKIFVPKMEISPESQQVVWVVKVVQKDQNDKGFKL